MLAVSQTDTTPVQKAIIRCKFHGSDSTVVTLEYCYTCTGVQLPRTNTVVVVSCKQKKT